MRGALLLPPNTGGRSSSIPMSGFPPFPASLPSIDPDIHMLPPGVSSSPPPVFSSWNTPPLALPETHPFCTSAPPSPFPPVTPPSRFLNRNDVAFPRKVHELKELVLTLRLLIAEANKAANDVLELMKLKHESLPRVCVADTVENLCFKEMSGPPVDVKCDSEVNDKHSKAVKMFSELYENLKNKIDPTNAFFYSDSPGVVQMHMYVDGLNNGKTMLPDFAAGESWAELTPSGASEEYSCVDEKGFNLFLLPSRLWSSEKEIDAWRDLPSHSNLSLLKVAWALQRVKVKDIKRFLLNHLSSYAISSCRTQVVNNVLYLIAFCLRAIQRTAAECIWKYNVDQRLPENDTVNREASELESETVVEFNVLVNSANWLASQLSLLCFPAASKSLVLHCYKHALKCAIRSFLPLRQSIDPSSSNSSQMGSTTSWVERSPQDSRSTLCVANDNAGRVLPFGQQDAIGDEEETLLKSVSLKAGRNNLEKKLDFQNFALDNCNSRSICFVGEAVLSLYNLAAAVLALEGLQDSLKCVKSDHEFFQSPPYHRLHFSNMIVERAEELRATRANYRPVLEYDGLIWQTPQNKELNRNKTKEEILAEERDYKRRRMSYRGKNVKRTPIQVLHDIINGHMQDIVASGGIGCFGRKMQETPLLSESLRTVECSKGMSDSLDPKGSGWNEHIGERERDYHKGSHGYGSTTRSHRTNTSSSRWESSFKEF